jgi:putative GTP pyrophosphokinase
LVNKFSSDIESFNFFASNLAQQIESSPVRKHYHSIKFRVKDPEHLRDKLKRKWAASQANGEPFQITPDNLYTSINDLAGVRILHLHTTQFAALNSDLLALLEEAMFPLREGPVARTWDDELRAYFMGIGVATKVSENMYTSVHYVVEANRRTKYTAEIQVRTLAEELWGEVDHTINYPHKTPSLPCQEQIKVLARVTSSCTRLVDAIFLTHREASGTSSE